MSDETKQQPSMPPEGANALTSTTSIEEILKNAQTALATITGFVETAKAATTAAAENQKLTATALTDAQTKVVEITTAAAQALASKTQITNEQTVIAEKSAHIQNAQEHADKVRAYLDHELTQAKQQVNAVEAHKSNIQSAAENATKLLIDIQTTKGAVETNVATVVTARKNAEESAAMMKGLADKSATVEARIADYEKRIAELGTQCADQLQTIEHLLPGATSAGLAHDFDKRRETFLKPHNRWQWVFVGSVLAIVVLAVTGWVHVYFAATPPNL